MGGRGTVVTSPEGPPLLEVEAAVPKGGHVAVAHAGAHRMGVAGMLLFVAHRVDPEGLGMIGTAAKSRGV